MAVVIGSHGGNQPRQQRPSLPTRRSKSILTRSSNDDVCNDDNGGIRESRQESQKHDDDDDSPKDDKKTPDEAIFEDEVANGNCTGNGTKGDEDDEERIPSPSSEGNDDESGDKASSVPVDNKKRVEEVMSDPQLLQPAFVFKDIGTIDTINAKVAIGMNNATEHSSTSIATTSTAQHQHSKYRYRSPSPQSGLVVSRRGRSRDRSPVSLKPRHLSPSKYTSLSPPKVGGRELSEAALAAGEAAAWNGDTSGGGTSYHPSQQSQGRRSPSPVSRFPSLSSHSFSFENLRAGHSAEMKIGSVEENGSGGEDEEGRIGGGGAAPLGSFDWNIGPSLSREQQQQRFPEQHMHPLPPTAQDQYYDHYPRDDRRSQPHPPPYRQYDDNHYHHPSPQYQDHRSGNIGVDGQYYERYHPSYQPNNNDQYHHDWNHNPDRLTSSRNSHYRCDNTNGHSHHRHDGRYQQQSHYHHSYPDNSSKHSVNQEYRQHSSRSLSSPNQQALFPEHHVMSGHSSSKNRHYNQGDPRGSSSSASRHRRGGGQDKTREGGGCGEISEKSSRRSKRKSNASPHRSSVFRGSPTPKDDNLPQELLLALESNEDETHHHHTSSTPPSKVAKTSSPSSPNNMLVDNQCMLGLEDVFQDPMLADDDYLNDATLSFRKSYDLEQMFSFIKEGNDGPTSSHPNDGGVPLQGQFSFNLGFITSKSMDDEDKGTTRSKNVKLSDGRNGRRCRKQSSSRGSNYKNELLLPSIQTLNSDDSTPSLGGLSPINSFRDVSMGTTDGLALRAFLSSSPQPTDNAPVVHASIPPAYNHEESTRYGPPPDNIDGEYNDANPPHETLSSGNPNDGHGKPSQASIEIKKSFPTIRIKISTRHTLHPIARDLLNRSEGDYFFLLKKLAPCFVGFRFKLPEIESCYDPSIHKDGITDTLLSDVQMSVAMRRISSSICAFGGTLPSRTVWPFSRSLSIYSSNSPNSIHSPASTRDAADSGMIPPIKEENPEDREDRENYEQSLSVRYIMKEHCISWDVELHEVIAPPRTSGKDKRGDIGTPKNSTNKQIGVFKPGEMTPPTSRYCAPVTPSATPGSTGDTLASGKGTKIKYRCKLCGQPKQNHSCPYESSVVRSIGTMVYPAVNAFVSNEPGRLAPALSEMNNFTSLLSQDTTIAGPAFAAVPYRHPQYPANRGVGGNPGNLLTPDTVHWSPNTPGGLSTISSVDFNSPSTAPSPGTPGGPPVSNMISSRHQGSNTHRREYQQPLTSRSMTRTKSTPLPTPPAPAGAIPSDVLFRDTMVLQREQFRTVSTSIDSNVVGGGHATLISPRAYCYPSIPTPYSQRKEMGDTLFALSREVPKLADSCAAILRDARENDDWDQAVAELTTQVIVVLKCEERDYTLEGLRRHLLALGIAC